MDDVRRTLSLMFFAPNLPVEVKMPENKRRPRPYVWVSWITSLLADTDQCEWKVWTKANFYYTKIEQKDNSEFFKEWTKRHDAMVQARAAKLKLEGYDVRVENENAFKLVGERGDLAGKPDIIGLKLAEKQALIVDEKSGRERPSDRWQVKLYIFAKRLLSLKDWAVNGEVEYMHRVEPVPGLEVEAVAISNISRVMKTVIGELAPRRVPSQQECSWCDIADCPDRMKGATPGVEPERTDAKQHF